jgi:dienelactone hydrolase
VTRLSAARAGAALVALAATAAAAPAPPACAAPALTADGRYRIPRGFDHDIVTIECSDGYVLAADYLRRSRPRARMPGVIFIHDALQDRHAWYPLSFISSGRGLGVLVPDLRGHGENPKAGSNPATPAADLNEAAWAAMADDLRHAVSSLAIRREVDGGMIGFVGTGVGASLALAAAAQPWAASVRCVIAISPVADRGFDPVAAARALPKDRRLYLAAAEDDALSFALCERIAAETRAKVEFRRSKGDAHGFPALGRDGLFQQIPLWLHEALFPQTGAASGPRG